LTTFRQKTGIVQPLFKNNSESGWWQPSRNLPDTSQQGLCEALYRAARPIFVVNFNGQPAVSQDGTITIGSRKPTASHLLPLIGYAPALHPKDLGDPEFKKSHNLRYAYVVGAMANGITSVEMVQEAGRNGMIGFFGAAGLLPDEIETAITRLQDSMGSRPFGLKQINNPNHTARE
jgi:trans-AT polyketide synthase/acyltransferase/oxidoreductase domain-containing protein